MSLHQPNNPVDASSDFHDVSMTIEIGDFKYVDPTHPGHDFFDKEIASEPKAAWLLAFGRRLFGG